ncbi:MAG TPA: aminopeptidase P family N-terminal domain-containing protein, partial [Actinomycetota bacterium]|nr:aminopeptidase P family N-terminal domain-containing protein [Actinomycetota bacterium]
MERLPAVGVEALLVSRMPNVRYLTGFTGSSAIAMVGTAGSAFFTDGRYGEQSRIEVPDLERVASMDPPAP